MAEDKPEITLVYDDLSWEAPDLRLVVQDEAKGLVFDRAMQPYKYAQQGIVQRDIRNRFRQAIEDFARLVPQMKVGRVFQGLSFVRQAIPYKPRLVSLSKFIAMHESDNPKRMYLTLPVNPVFVSLHFADVAEEEETKEVSVGVYSSPTAIALIREWNARVIGTNSTFTSDSWTTEYIKAVSRITSLALVRTNAETFSVKQIYNVRELTKEWLRLEFSIVRTAVAAKLNLPFIDPVSAWEDVFFTESKNARAEQFNLEAITEIMDSAQMSVKMYQHNVNEAHTLRQIITHGLASNSSSPEFSQFLGKGLYDPRLWLHVWDMINRKKED